MKAVLGRALRRARGVERTLVVTAAIVAATALGAPVRAQISVGRVAGKVVDETGVPIATATVRAESATASPGSLTGTTDDKGQFAILGFRRGLWTITITAPGFEPQEIRLPVRGRLDARSMTVTLRRGRMPGARSRLGGVDVEALQAALGEAEGLAADGRIDEALAIYERLAHSVPALTAIDREIGDLYIRKKDRARALGAYQRLLDAEPDDEAAGGTVSALALELGLEAEAAGDREAAIRYLEQSLAAEPEGPRAAETRAALARVRKV